MLLITVVIILIATITIIVTTRRVLISKFIFSKLKARNFVEYASIKGVCFRVKTLEQLISCNLSSLSLHPG